MVYFVLLFLLNVVTSPITVPSAPPTKLGISVRDSQSLLVYWLDVPPEHRNGVIRGYRLTYWSASNGTSSVITKRMYSEVLTQLQKATEYRVKVWAYNNAGDGISDSYTATTGEDGKQREVLSCVILM